MIMMNVFIIILCMCEGVGLCSWETGVVIGMDWVFLVRQ